MPLKINLTADRLRTLDKSDMLGKTLELPKQIAEGMRIGDEFASKHKLPEVRVLDWVGLGGSAVAGDLLRGFGFEPPSVRLSIHVHRTPVPPRTRYKRLLCSYSGNTAETLYAFDQTEASQVWLTMCSGGKLADKAVEKRVPLVRLPTGYPPRAAVGFSLGIMIALLEHHYRRGERASHSMLLAALDKDAKSYTAFDQEANPALRLAVQLVNKTPVLYSLDSLSAPLCIRFRAQLAENAKVWSHSAPLPEMAHNEVEAFQALGQVDPAPLVIFLGGWNFAGIFADPRAGMRTLLDSFRIAHLTLDPSELWGNELSRLEAGLRMMLLLDAASVYLAVLRAVDPSEIPIITKLKNYPPVA